jgi:hypothetical protein
VHRLLATCALCLTLGACATATHERLAVCDGRHRRPANPNGSVLAPRPLPAVASAASPNPAPARGPTTASSDAPCGDRR